MALVEKKVSNYSIDKKINNFTKWYFKNFIEGEHTNSGEFYFPRMMINSIEKMAVWYEFRYPDCEVSKRYPGSSYEELDVDNKLIKKNPAINEIEEVLDDDEKIVFREAIDMLTWEKFLAPETYLSSLQNSEKWFLRNPEVNRVVYLDNDKHSHLHINEKGIVIESESVENNYNFEGWHISEVIDHLKKVKYPVKGSEILEYFENYKKLCDLKENFLDMVMYRIIERGENRIGSRRAFMFALEFERNFDIPMIYGIDYSDPGLRFFINEYIKVGGNTDLECLINYGSRKKDNEPLRTVTIGEILKNHKANSADKYTEEETALHQRLVDCFVNGLPIEEEPIDQQLNGGYQKKIGS